MGAVDEDTLTKRKYFLWLCWQTGTNESKEDTLNLDMCWWLHNHEFHPFLPNDDNRAADGMNLRKLFADNFLQRVDCACLDGPCTMLEMLIGLAVHMDYILSDSPAVTLVSKCFWEMIDNLGLKLYPPGDTRWYDNEQILEIFMERKYRRDGEGGLFPLRKVNQGIPDQTKIELWYQMMNYLGQKMEK